MERCSEERKQKKEIQAVNRYIIGSCRSVNLHEACFIENRQLFFPSFFFSLLLILIRFFFRKLQFSGSYSLTV